MIKRILVPIDGSEYSNRAINYACNIAKKFKSELTLICVVPPPILFGAEAGITDFGALEDAGKKIINSSKKLVEDKGFKPILKLEIGQVADKIIQIASDEDFDLIIMGSRGLSAIKSFLLGSVSDKVSHHAPCPVLIVR